MHTDLEKLESEMRKCLRGLSSNGTQARPSARPSAWNVQEVVEHLVLTWQSNIGQIEDRLAKGRPVKTKVNLRMRFAQTMLITLGRFPKGFDAPPQVVPPVNAPPKSGAELSERVSMVLRRLDEVCASAEAMFGSPRSVTHFRLGPLSIAQWRKFHLVHARHHVHQIDAIRREYGLEAISADVG